MFSRMDSLLMCCFEDNIEISDAPTEVKLLWDGDWVALFSKLLGDITLREDILALISDVKTQEEENFTTIICCAIASVCAFCEANWTGPEKSKAEDIVNKYLFPLYDNIDLAQPGEECSPTITHIPLLHFAVDVFDNLLPGSNLVVLWWKLRSYSIYQQILDENSPRIFSVMDNTLKLLSNLESTLKEFADMQTLLNIEMSQAYLLYGRVQNSKACLEKASSICGLSLSLKGALGKRTKFQQEAVAQLGVDVITSDTYNRRLAHVTHENTRLLNLLNLDDDVRLERIEYLNNKDNCNPVITSLEQQLCLATVQYVQRSQPKDELANEELMPYLNLLLSQVYGPWSSRINVFLMKCRLESQNKRTVERAMMQCEQIVNNFSISQPGICSRLSYLWASALPPYICWKSLLGDLLLSIGMVKTALDVYLDIELWEEVIACYTILDLRHKAAEIIHQQIALKPTVKLYCLLGDATDDASQFAVAWHFSDQKSSRAQRHWGNYLFAHKKYEECIPHYEKSCEINSLQESVWLRLGYAALTVEKWNIAANAYRRYTYLDPHSFEAWNNLAKVYVKQGNKERAYKALNEALKYNYDNWQVWENLLVVSVDTGHIDNVIRSYNRILDIKKKHLDVEVLALLVKSILREKESNEDSTKRVISKVLELFGRITSIHPTDFNVWQFYADISPNVLLKGQRLLKVYSSATSQNASWINDKILTENILNVTETLSNCALQAVKEIDLLDKIQVWQLVSSARLTTQAVIRIIQNQDYQDFKERVDYLQNMLQQLTTELQKR